MHVHDTYADGLSFLNFISLIFFVASICICSYKLLNTYNVDYNMCMCKLVDNELVSEVVVLCIYSFDSKQDGSTALHVASQEGECEIVQILLEAKADVNVKDNVSEIELSIVVYGVYAAVGN